MKKLVALTVACMAVVALGACGSSSKNASTDKAAATTTTAAAKVAVGANVAADLLKYCDYSKAAQDASSAASTTGSNLKSSLQNMKGNLDAYASAAPAEIRADVRLTVDKSLKPFITEMERVNYDFTKVNPSALEGLASAEVQAASQRISAYYAAHCKK
jgi:uncharacterized lipoprotein YehR (DUF1307 family)